MKRPRIALYLLAAFGLALILAAAAFFNIGLFLNPHDLRLVSVEVMPTADTPRAKRNPDPRTEWAGLSYRITLTSASNLGDSIDDWSLYATVDPRFPVLRNGREAWPWIFGPLQDGRLLPYRSTRAEDAARRAEPPKAAYSYTVYLEAVDEARYVDDFNTTVPYDLLTHPEPVRFRLTAGNMALQSIKTNEVVIPARTFAEAYARYQRNQTP